MARLIIVSGASGAGKSFLLEQISVTASSKVKPLKKYTTRTHRHTENPKESNDLIFDCSEDALESCDYGYRYCSHDYGFNKVDIDNLLSKGVSPIVIVAKCHTINEIKSDYPSALVLYVQNVLSGNDLKVELERQRDPIEIEERMRRQQDSFFDYIKNIDKKIFDYVLINNFSEQFKSQIDYILHQELKVNDFGYIFVIMSFDKSLDNEYSAIKACGDFFRKKIERVSDVKGGAYKITNKIEECIEKAGLIICDISIPSTNVYYEFGYARAKNKQIILTKKVEDLSQGITNLPFDIQDCNVIPYDSPTELQRQIKLKLKEYFESTRE